MEPLLLRVEEAARLLGIGRSKTYELVARGELPSISVGKCRRIPADALRRWVADRVERQDAARRTAGWVVVGGAKEGDDEEVGLAA